MTDWCTGTLKVRGTIDNLKAFLLNGLQSCENILNEEIGGGVVIVDSNNKICEEIGSKGYKVLNVKDSWIENTTRGFALPFTLEWDSVLSQLSSNTDDKAIIYFTSYFAWDVNANELLKTCKHYNVDMRICAFGRAKYGFMREIVIENNAILFNKKTLYENYLWECPYPYEF